jgi:hypothetical protein
MKAANLRDYGLENPHEARKLCAKVGLWPWISLDKKQLATLALVSKANGFNSAGKGGLALGYDPSCEGTCSGIF